MAKIKIDVEDLVVWALVRQCANVDRGQGIMQELRQLSGGGITATAALENYLSVGSRIDGGPGPSDHRTPADALKVAGAIDRLPVEAAALIVMATRQSIDWGEEGVGQWIAVKDKRGKHRKIWQDIEQSRGLLGWDWKWEGLLPSEINEMRLAYWMWWHALVDLRDALDGRLTGWEIAGPRRAPEPWNEQPVRILHPVDDRALT